MTALSSFTYQVPLLGERDREIRAIPPGPESSGISRLRATLDPTLSLKISTGAELIRSLQKTSREEKILTTITPLDQLLGGGLPRGRMVELTGRRSTGRFAVALATLSAATSAGEAAALIDLGDSLDPRQAAAAGAELDRLLWVRPETFKQAMIAAETLIATRFQLVVVDLGIQPRGKRPSEAAWIRLARASESHGTALFLLTPYAVSGTAAEVVISATHSRGRWEGEGRRPRLLSSISSQLTLEKHRHLRAGTHELLALRHEETISGTISATISGTTSQAVHGQPELYPAGQTARGKRMRFDQRIRMSS